MSDKITLRPYQEEIITKALNSDEKRMLVSLPTGTGKTIVFSEITKRYQKPTLILAHRDELIEQAVDKLLSVYPDAEIGVVKAERNEIDHEITIASVQTVGRKKRLEQLRPDFGLIITDEAHHAAANSYKRIYHRYGLLEDSPDDIPMEVLEINAVHLGVTATPMRNDKMGLASIYDKIIYEGVFKDFVDDGFLCDLHFEGVMSSIDLHGVKSTTLSGYGRDFQTSSLSEAINKEEIHYDIFTAYQKYAKDRKHTLVFAVDRAHARALCDSFIERGVPCGYIDGETPKAERKEVLQDFRDGKTKILFNIMVLTEGFDFPEIDCILLARPSKSPSLLTQMIGRGTRPSPGKDNCLILDVAHSHRVERDRKTGEIKHAGSLLELASIFYPPIETLAADKEEKEGMDDLDRVPEENPVSGGAGKAGPDEHYLGSASSEVSIAQYLSKNYRAKFHWHSQPATTNQMKYIERMLPEAEKNISRGEAATLLDHLFSKGKKKKAIPQQMPDIAPSHPKEMKQENTCPTCKKWKQERYPYCYTCNRSMREAQAEHFAPDTQDVIPFLL